MHIFKHKCIVLYYMNMCTLIYVNDIYLILFIDKILILICVHAWYWYSCTHALIFGMVPPRLSCVLLFDFLIPRLTGFPVDPSSVGLISYAPLHKRQVEQCYFRASMNAMWLWGLLLVPSDVTPSSIWHLGVRWGRGPGFNSRRLGFEMGAHVHLFSRFIVQSDEGNRFRVYLFCMIKPGVPVNCPLKAERHWSQPCYFFSCGQRCIRRLGSNAADELPPCPAPWHGRSAEGGFWRSVAVASSWCYQFGVLNLSMMPMLSIIGMMSMM